MVVYEYPSQAKIKRMFTYKDGDLVFKGGQLAGKIDKRDGRAYVVIGRIKYLEHRLIYIFHHGDINSKSLVIDHIDRNTKNNRIENLRLVTHQENMFNKETKKGYRKWGKSKFMAKIVTNGICKELGIFDTEEEARTAYLKAERVYHIIKKHEVDETQNERPIC